MPRLQIATNQPPLWPTQRVTATSPLQPDQIEMPPDYELMELDIPEDTPDLLDVPEEVISSFNALVQNVLHYQW